MRLRWQQILEVQWHSLRNTLLLQINKYGGESSEGVAELTLSLVHLSLGEEAKATSLAGHGAQSCNTQIQIFDEHSKYNDVQMHAIFYAVSLIFMLWVLCWIGKIKRPEAKLDRFRLEWTIPKQQQRKKKKKKHTAGVIKRLMIATKTYQKS